MGAKDADEVHERYLSGACLVAGAMYVEGERVQIIEYVRVLGSTCPMPPHDRQPGVPKELEHHNATRVLDEGDVERGVAQQQGWWWICDVTRQEDEGGDDNRQDELEAMLPRIVLEVFKVRPDLLVFKQVGKALQVAIPPENEDGKPEVGVRMEAVSTFRPLPLVR